MINKKNITLFGLIILSTGCSFNDEKMRILTKNINLNAFNRNYQLQPQELALHTRNAGTRLSFVEKTKQGGFLGCVEPSPDALTALSLDLKNDIKDIDKVSAEQRIQLATAMQLATYRSQGLQIYRDTKMSQCMAVMNLTTLVAENPDDQDFKRQLNEAITHYNNDKDILKTLMPLLLKEVEKPINITLQSVSAKTKSKIEEKPTTPENEK